MNHIYTNPLPDEDLRDEILVGSPIYIVGWPRVKCHQITNLMEAKNPTGTNWTGTGLNRPNIFEHRTQLDQFGLHSSIAGYKPGLHRRSKPSTSEIGCDSQTCPSRVVVCSREGVANTQRIRVKASQTAAHAEICRRTSAKSVCSESVLCIKPFAPAANAFLVKFFAGLALTIMTGNYFGFTCQKSLRHLGSPGSRCPHRPAGS
jgi:hypothetical protein